MQGVKQHTKSELKSLIQLIEGGATKGPKALICLMVGKSSKEKSVDLELKRMKIQECGVKKAIKERRVIKLLPIYLLKVHHGN